jgi:hypothetical protein
MNNHEGGPEVYLRGAFAFALLGLIVINLGLILSVWAGIRRCYFSLERAPL